MKGLLLTGALGLAVLAAIPAAAQNTNADGEKLGDLREMCQGNSDSPECRRMHHHKRGGRMAHARKICRQNPDSEECLQARERWQAKKQERREFCEANPDSRRCARAKDRRGRNDTAG